MTSKRVNENPRVSPPSEAELALLARIGEIPPSPIPGSRPSKRIEPALPPIGPSRFLKLESGESDRGTSRIEWVNEPPLSVLLFQGMGCGFGKFEQRPYIVQNRPKPPKPPQIWHFPHYWLAVSPEVRDVICSFDAEAIEFCEIDWEYNDGGRLDGYGFVDVIRLLDAYDYDRCQLDVELSKDGSKRVQRILTPEVLRTDIPPEVHLLRDARHRLTIYVSCELASALAPYIAKDVEFLDPHALYKRVKFNTRKTRRPATVPPPAIVHDLPRAPVNPVADFGKQIRREIPPLLDAGRFAEAEAKLTQWMQELPASPYHVAIDPGVAISNPREEVAAFVNAFISKAVQEMKPKVIYAELNAFTINPDQWHFGLFAFEFDGGREDYNWLGDFGACSDDWFVIRGMEPLQAIYAKRDSSISDPQYSRASEIAEWLVIVRFQRMLQNALPLIKRKIPLLASAHDYSELIVQIRSAPGGEGA